MESARNEGNLPRRQVKAILFSNFPRDVFENTLKPKFDTYNIEITRTVNIDRSPSIDIGDAELVIAMVELMSGGQRAKVKEIARRNGKRYVGLHRKGADWERDLGGVLEDMERRKTAPVPPPQTAAKMVPMFPRVVPPPPPEPESEEEIPEPTPEDLELLRLFEEENVKLEKRIDELEQENEQLKAGLEYANSTRTPHNPDVDDLIRRLKNADEEIRLHKRSIEKANLERDQGYAQLRKAQDDLKASKNEQGRLVEEIAKMMHRQEGADRRIDKSVLDLTNKLEEAEKQLAEKEQYVLSAQRQVSAFQAQHTTLQAELNKALELTKKQGEEIFRLKNTMPPASGRTTMKATEDFLRVRDAFKTLWRSGVMNDKEILQKLIEWEPKE